MDERSCGPLDYVAVWLEQHHTSYDRNTDGIVTSIELQRGQHLCWISASPYRFLIDSVFPFSAGSAKRMLAAEFATRANLHIPLGMVTVDVDGGDIGLKSLVLLSTHAPTFELTVALLRQHLVIAECLVPGLASVVFNDVAPRVALRQCLSSMPLSQAVDEANQRMQDD